MEESSLVGKKILLIKSDFDKEDIYKLEKENQCEFIESITKALSYDFSFYDHFFCRYSFQMKEVSKLFEKINSYSGISSNFLISPSELKRLKEEDLTNKERIKEAQNQINQYLEKYPEFFHKIEPDFFRKRLINFTILKCGDTNPNDIAIFSFSKNELHLLSRSEITKDIITLSLRVNISFGNEKEYFDLTLQGKCSLIELDIEDKDNVNCYNFTFKESNEAFDEVIEALELQESTLHKRMSSGGYE